MAEKISELTGDAREQRIAELKAKMQAAAARAKANHEETGSPRGAADEAPASAPAEESAEPVAATEAEPVAAAEAAPARPAVAPAKPAPRAANGAAAPARPAPARPAPSADDSADGNAPSPGEMNRREFLIYAWGAALGLLALETGVLSYLYMYPRFRAGEFGGQFFLDQSIVPGPDAPPEGNAVGKFWLVSTDEGNPKALYMVCTHLGCLYKWEPSAFRFECPCHGSKFTKDGFFIEGPAPRSLDEFEVTVEDGTVIVDTGRRINGAPATESPARIIEA